MRHKVHAPRSADTQIVLGPAQVTQSNTTGKAGMRLKTHQSALLGGVNMMYGDGYYCGAEKYVPPAEDKPVSKPEDDEEDSENKPDSPVSVPDATGNSDHLAVTPLGVGPWPK